MRLWLDEVNNERPSRATGEIPQQRRQQELPRLRPLRVSPDRLALRIPIQVSVTAEVSFDGRSYAMPPEAVGMSGTLFLYRDQRGRPMLFTTNKPPLTAWGDVLHDHDLAEAIVDRVLENGRLLLLDGPSFRTRQPARISGNQPAEFPEPTPSTTGGRRRRTARLGRYVRFLPWGGTYTRLAAGQPRARAPPTA